MATITTENVAARLAALLLEQDGEVSVTEIEALPTINTHAQARDVAHHLLRVYDAIPVQRRIPGVTGAWEEVIRLRVAGSQWDPVKLAFAVSDA